MYGVEKSRVVCWIRGGVNRALVKDNLSIDGRRSSSRIMFRGSDESGLGLLNAVLSRRVH
jgi:hypothetical protein